MIIYWIKKLKWKMKDWFRDFKGRKYNKKFDSVDFYCQHCHLYHCSCCNEKFVGCQNCGFYSCNPKLKELKECPKCKKNGKTFYNSIKDLEGF